MKRTPFERPSNRYEKHLILIDEQICALLKQRKDVSNDNPSFPSDDVISNWAVSTTFMRIIYVHSSRQ